MEEKNYTGLIPAIEEGRSFKAEASIECDSQEDAKMMYKIARERLLYVPNWAELAGKAGAHFELTDASGNVVNRFTQKGDHYKIDIPGPGSVAGEGYDWVQVEDVKEVHEPGIDSIAIRVRPTSNPQTPNENIAHFFSEHSTSTFIITREGNTVIASIYDRNIDANEETKEPLDKVRNAVVGLSGKHGAAKLQWQALADGLVKR